ncbi:DUF2852 domain-containing protein [Microvirga sp. BT688]|uniref:DUF2852 domain-containing protein n=1 Tax=Microvirga sp. TaxID=1873136 RepID=UPI00168321BA|nr:DUF2852 domain-containing protein [Microvirga sp.]MBD2745359.1 DUF2852 domain-containing protein [Microvirga sp.]
MSDSASAAWNAGPHAGPWDNRTTRRHGRKPGRGLEIAGIILGFIFVWPLALAYLVWKMCEYPKYDEAKSFLRDTFGRARDDLASRGAAGFGGFASTGNAAFDDYRRSEIERLEEERRKLDEEARDFRNFVEELKRAKDREEFDAYMARRRGNGPTNV